jgi:hypothetical protein
MILNYSLSKCSILSYNSIPTCLPTNLCKINGKAAEMSRFSRHNSYVQVANLYLHNYYVPAPTSKHLHKVII